MPAAVGSRNIRANSNFSTGVMTFQTEHYRSRNGVVTTTHFRGSCWGSGRLASCRRNPRVGSTESQAWRRVRRLLYIPGVHVVYFDKEFQHAESSSGSQGILTSWMSSSPNRQAGILAITVQKAASCFDLRYPDTNRHVRLDISREIAFERLVYIEKNIAVLTTAARRSFFPGASKCL